MVYHNHCNFLLIIIFNYPIDLLQIRHEKQRHIIQLFLPIISYLPSSKRQSTALQKYIITKEL